MSEEKKKQIARAVEGLKELDETSLHLIEHDVNLLKAKEALDKKNASKTKPKEVK